MKSHAVVVVAALAVTLGACGGGETEEPGDVAALTSIAPDTTAAADISTTDAAYTEAPALAGTDWNVVLYVEGSSMVELWPGTEITLGFGDGTISGSGGCNQYDGTHAVDGPYDEFTEGVRDENDGQAISVEVVSVTEIGCTEPSGVMDQESEYLKALESSARWLIARGNLLLRTGDGFFLIEAEPAG